MKGEKWLQILGRVSFYLFIAFICLTFSACSKRASLSVVTLQNENFYFKTGNIPEGDKIRHIFRLKNEDSRYPIIISEISKSCSCTSIDAEKKAVNPGQSIDFEMTVDTVNHDGYFMPISTILWHYANGTDLHQIKVGLIVQCY